MPIENPPSTSTRNTTLIAIVVVGALLYVARVVFIPLALAILVSFLLAPLVIRLRNWGWPRVPAALLVVALALSLVLLIGGFVVVQATDVAQKLPEYQQNIRQKIHALQASGGGAMHRLTHAIHEFTEELNPSAPPTRAAPGEERPVPVEIRSSSLSALQIVSAVVGPVINIALMATIVLVFVIFILFQWEDLRDRMIRLMGVGRLNVTTAALDDAAHRVSRYLLAQLIVNCTYAIPVGIGLYFIGVPNPILWAVLAALLRYVPYLGIWIAAAMPAAVAFAVDPGWLKALSIFTLFFGTDIIVCNFVEPPLYGSSTGISPVAILLAAVFWTWLWGPVGLLLSTPLTVCLVVIGRYVPSMEFLSVLLSDEPVLAPEKRFYQRMLAEDIEEATEVAEEFVRGKSLEALYDQVILPALSLAEEDRHRGRLNDQQQQFVIQNVRMLIDEIGDHYDELVGEKKPDRDGALAKEREHQMVQTASDAVVLSLPARDEADEIAAYMLAQLLNRRGVAARALSAVALASEQIEEATRLPVKVVCVAAVPPFGYLHARYLAKRLRAQFTDVKIVVAILNQGDRSELRQRQPGIPADEITTSLEQTVAEILALLPQPPEPVEQTAFST